MKAKMRKRTLSMVVDKEFKKDVTMSDMMKKMPKSDMMMSIRSMTNMENKGDMEIMNKHKTKRRK